MLATMDGSIVQIEQQLPAKKIDKRVTGNHQMFNLTNGNSSQFISFQQQINKQNKAITRNNFYSPNSQMQAPTIESIKLGQN